MDEFPYLTVEHKVLKRNVQFKFNPERCRKAGLEETPNSDKYEVVKLRRVYHFHKDTPDHIMFTIPKPVFIVVNKDHIPEENYLDINHDSKCATTDKENGYQNVKKRINGEYFCDDPGNEVIIHKCTSEIEAEPEGFCDVSQTNNTNISDEFNSNTPVLEPEVIISRHTNISDNKNKSICEEEWFRIDSEVPTNNQFYNTEEPIINKKIDEETSESLSIFDRINNSEDTSIYGKQKDTNMFNPVEEQMRKIHAEYVIQEHSYFQPLIDVECVSRKNILDPEVIISNHSNINDNKNKSVHEEEVLTNNQLYHTNLIPLEEPQINKKIDEETSANLSIFDQINNSEDISIYGKQQENKQKDINIFDPVKEETRKIHPESVIREHSYFQPIIDVECVPRKNFKISEQFKIQKPIEKENNNQVIDFSKIIKATETKRPKLKILENFLIKPAQKRNDTSQKSLPHSLIETNFNKYSQNVDKIDSPEESSKIEQPFTNGFQIIKQTCTKVFQDSSIFKEPQIVETVPIVECQNLKQSLTKTAQNLEYPLKSSFIIQEYRNPITEKSLITEKFQIMEKPRPISPQGKAEYQNLNHYNSPITKTVSILQQESIKIDVKTNEHHLGVQQSNQCDTKESQFLREPICPITVEPEMLQKILQIDSPIIKESFSNYHKTKEHQIIPQPAKGCATITTEILNQPVQDSDTIFQILQEPSQIDLETKKHQTVTQPAQCGTVSMECVNLKQSGENDFSNIIQTPKIHSKLKKDQNINQYPFGECDFTMKEPIKPNTVVITTCFDCPITKESQILQQSFHVEPVNKQQELVSIENEQQVSEELNKSSPALPQFEILEEHVQDSELLISGQPLKINPVIKEEQLSIQCDGSIEKEPQALKEPIKIINTITPQLEILEEFVQDSEPVTKEPLILEQPLQIDPVTKEQLPVQCVPIAKEPQILQQALEEPIQNSAITPQPEILGVSVQDGETITNEPLILEQPLQVGAITKEQQPVQSKEPPALEELIKISTITPQLEVLGESVQDSESVTKVPLMLEQPITKEQQLFQSIPIEKQLQNFENPIKIGTITSQPEILQGSVQDGETTMITNEFLILEQPLQVCAATKEQLPEPIKISTVTPQLEILKKSAQDGEPITKESFILEQPINKNQQFVQSIPMEKQLQVLEEPVLVPYSISPIIPQAEILKKPMQEEVSTTKVHQNLKQDIYIRNEPIQIGNKRKEHQAVEQPAFNAKEIRILEEPVKVNSITTEPEILNAKELPEILQEAIQSKPETKDVKQSIQNNLNEVLENGLKKAMEKTNSFSYKKKLRSSQQQISNDDTLKDSKFTTDKIPDKYSQKPKFRIVKMLNLNKNKPKVLRKRQTFLDKPSSFTIKTTPVEKLPVEECVVPDNIENKKCDISFDELIPKIVENYGNNLEETYVNGGTIPKVPVTNPVKEKSKDLEENSKTAEENIFESNEYDMVDESMVIKMVINEKFKRIVKNKLRRNSYNDNNHTCDILPPKTLCNNKKEIDNMSYPSAEDSLEQEMRRIHENNISKEEPLKKKPRIDEDPSKEDVHGFTREEQTNSPVSVICNSPILEQKNKSYKCKDCDFSVTSKNYLKIHSRIHIEPFWCNICSEKYSKIEDLEYHVKGYHIEIISANTPGKSLQTGEKPFNKTKVQTYKCAFCKYSSSYIKRFQNHVMVHTKEKLYNCKECGYITASKWVMDRHQNDHKSVKEQYECEECCYITVFRDKLDEHMQIHNLKKAYECNECSFSTAHLGYFNVHMSFHKLKEEEIGDDEKSNVIDLTNMKKLD